MDLDLLCSLCSLSGSNGRPALRSLGPFSSYPSPPISWGRSFLRLPCDESEVFDMEKLRLRLRLRSTSRLENTWL